MIDNELTGQNLTLYAAHYYKNDQCFDKEEFVEDLNRFKYLKKLINKYLYNEKDDYTKTFRLILNHIIIIYNVFEKKAAHKIMLFKLDGEQMSIVKTCLLHVGLIRPNEFADTPLNKRAIEACRKI